MQYSFRQISAVCASLFAIAGVAHSDSRADYSVTTSAASGGLTPQIDLATLVHGSVEREEMTITQPVSAHIVALVDGSANTYTILDPVLKIYAATPLSAAPPDRFGVANFEALFQSLQSPSTAKTGTISNTVTVKDLAMDTPTGLTGTAHHFQIHSHRVSSGAAGDSDLTSDIDIWVDPALERPNFAAGLATPRTIITANGAQVTYTLSGDVSAYNDIARFLPVEIKATTSHGAQTVTRTSSASGPQDPSLFSVPSDYKKLTSSGFAQAEQDALLDQFSGPQPKLPAK